jgi:hypothetical protein
MSSNNKLNLKLFEANSMPELYECMLKWQNENQTRLLSINIQPDAGKFYCIGLTNPSEVVITSADGKRHADISWLGSLCTC